MKARPFLLLVPFLCVAGSLLVVAACSDDAAEPSPKSEVDASSEASATPAPTSTGGPTDGGSPPAPTDASSSADADAATGPVTVRVRDAANKPLPGAPVLFSDAAGAKLGVVSSDANGVASYPAPSGSQVTVSFGGELRPRLLTITAVEPGDDLLAIDTEQSRLNGLAPLTLESPPPDGPSASSYQVVVGRCETGGGNFPQTLYPSPSCGRLDVPMTVYIEARGGGGVPLAWASTNVSLVLDGGAQPALTFGPWTTSFTRQTVTVANAGDAGSALLVRHYDVSNGQLMLKGGLRNPPVSGNDRTATFTSVPVADGRQAEALTERYSAAGLSVVGTAARTAAAVLDGGLSLEFGDRLPALSGTGLDAGSEARPFVSWTSTGSLAGTDGTYVVLSWSEPLDAGKAYGSWTLLVPPTASSVQTPALPAGFRGAPSTLSEFFNPTPAVVSLEASFIPGYAKLRSVGGLLTPPSELAAGGTLVLPALPQNGTVRYSAFTVNAR